MCCPFVLGFSFYEKNSTSKILKIYVNEKKNVNNCFFVAKFFC